MDNYVALHTHTMYSNGRFLDSINKPEDIIRSIYNLGQPAFAITDHGTCSGLMDVYSNLQKFNKKHKSDIKMLFGAELYYTYDLTIRQDDLTHILFIAKNNIGLQNLYRLTSASHGDKGNHPEYFYKFPRVDMDLIRKYSEGLFCGTACMGGILKRENGEEVLLQLKEIFGERLFIELHTVQEDEQYVFNREALELGLKHNIQFVTANDAHYPTPGDYLLHKQFREAKDTKEDTGDGYYRTNDYYLHTSGETQAKLKYLPEDIIKEAIANTVKIADMCHIEIDYKTKHYPEYPCDDPVEEVRKQARVGWRQKRINKYPDKQQYIDRFNMEMGVLQKQDYCSYFLITSDLYRFGRENKYPMGDGRGSVVASEVAWLLGITQLDPIRYNLVFERFAHNERIAPPDKNNVEHYRNVVC